jgi:hypothetical protein
VVRYAICAGSDLSTSKTAQTGSAGANGDVHVNGKLSWTDSGSVVNGDVSATGTISSPYPTITGTATPGADPLVFPPIDLAYYQAIADEIYTGDHNFTAGISFPSDHYVIYVAGKSQIQGTVTGRGILVTDDVVQIIGSLTYADPATDKIAVITPQEINIRAHGLTVDAFLYAHRDNNDAKVGDDNTKDTMLWGGIAADQVKLTTKGSGNTVIHDPDFSDFDFCRAMHLPGFRS